MNKHLKKAISDMEISKKKYLLKYLGVSSENEISLKKLNAIVMNKNAESEARSMACLLIGKIKNRYSLNALFFAFQDSNEILHYTSLLCFWNSLKVRDFMLEKLNSVVITEKTGAAYVLSWFYEDINVINALYSILNDTSNPLETRIQAADSLGEIIGDTHLTTPLVKYLEDDSIDIRHSCLFGLYQFCVDSSVVPAIEKLLKDNSVVSGFISGKKIMCEEARVVIRVIQARAKFLKNKDKSKFSIRDINQEVRLELERMDEFGIQPR